MTEERKELYDFASYRKDLLGFYVLVDSDIESITEAADIAGLKITVGSGTNQEQILLRWNEELEADGKAPAELQYYDDSAAASLALQSGRVDASFGPNATAAWSALETGDTKLVGIVNGGWPDTAHIAAGTAKGNGLIEAVSIVLNTVIEDGTYSELLEFWGLESEAVTESRGQPARAAQAVSASRGGVRSAGPATTRQNRGRVLGASLETVKTGTRRTGGTTYRRPAGEVHSTAPPLSGICFRCQPPWCFTLWWPLQSGARFSRAVSPPCSHAIVWSISHRDAGIPHPGPMHRSARHFASRLSDAGGEYWLRPTESTAPVSGCVSTRIHKHPRPPTQCWCTA